MKTLTDKYNRKHDYLRISLTDRCNLNCLYCNPLTHQQNNYHHSEILDYSEILRLIKIFTGEFNFKKIRFTGGEPLVRKDILTFFESVSELKSIYAFDISLTTNGTFLEDKLTSLKKFGVNKLNISLDSLKEKKYKFITGKNYLKNVIKSIDKAEKLGFDPLKINVVVLKDVNDNEIIDFVEFVKDRNLNVRFIEFMPFGNNSWSIKNFISFNKIKNIVEQKYALQEIPSIKNTVAKDFKISNYTGRVSFISSISDNFCRGCNRLRITSKGKMKLCLFSTGNNELDFKQLFSNMNKSDNEICNIISQALQQKQKQHPDVEQLITLEKNNMLSIGG
ncbi:MAG: GTP 3',8-cyclase MoaA [Planctomycetia bacterium]|nr:GTP 3',8-cyclase MoaA [Planctomycetia bacterium]